MRGTSLGESVGIMGAANAVAFLAGIVRQKVFAVFLGPGGYGAFALAASFFELMGVVARGGAHVGLLRKMAQGLQDGRGREAAGLLVSVRRILISLSLLLALAAVAFREPAGRFLFRGELPGWALIALGLSLPFLVLTGLLGALLNALDAIRRLAAAQVLGTLLSLVVMVFLVAGFGLSGAIVQIATGTLLGFCAIAILARPVVRQAPFKPPARPLGATDPMVLSVFSLGLALTLYHLAVGGNLFVFRHVIVGELGTAPNGVYQGVLGLSRQYQGALMAGIFVYLYPRLSASVEDRTTFRTHLEGAIRFGLLLAVPISLVLLGFRDWLVSLVFSSAFIDMIPLMAYSLPADVLVLLGSILRSAVLACAGPMAFAALGIGSELAYLALFLGGMRVWGLAGAVGSYLVFGVLSTAVFGFYLWARGMVRVPVGLWARGFLGGALVTSVLALPAGTGPSRAWACATTAVWCYVHRRDLMEGFRR